MFIVLAVFDLLYIMVSIIIFTRPCQGTDALVHELKHVIALTQACCTSSCSRALSCIVNVESPVCVSVCVCVCQCVCVCRCVPWKFLVMFWGVAEKGSATQSMPTQCMQMMHYLLITLSLYASMLYHHNHTTNQCIFGYYWCSTQTLKKKEYTNNWIRMDLITRTQK
jgi:hypothetical protein